MPKKFYTLLKIDKYDIGLTSKTIYVYDKNGNEIVKFKDLDYAYKGCVSPDQKMLVIKSASGNLAFYSLEKLCLIKKFRFSKINCAQDDNFVFSLDNKYFYNIERHVSSTKTALSIYNTSDFSLFKRLFADNDNLVLSIIEYDNESNNYFISGYFRDLNTNVASKFFVAKLVNDKLEEIKYFDEKTHFFLQAAKAIEAAGFTEESYKWSFIHQTFSLEQLKNIDLSLANIWKKDKFI